MIDIASESKPLDFIWRKIKFVRKGYNNLETDIPVCRFDKDTLKIFDMKRNFQNVSQLLNIRNVSNETHEVSENVLAIGAEMFIYLNACPFEQENWKKYFTEILLEAPLSNLYLNLLKVSKTTRSYDAKLIVKKFQEKLKKILSLKIKKTSDNGL